MKPLQILVCAALCGFSGCVSSPQARIDEDPALFKSYSAHQQYLIRKGQIEVGFDQDQVRLAWGNPQRTRQDTSAQGTQLIWEYTELQPVWALSPVRPSNAGWTPECARTRQPDKN